MYSSQARCFQGVFRGAGGFQSELFRYESPVCNYLLQTNGYHVRGVNPSDLRMSMKNSLPVNQKTWEVVTSWLWRTHGQWFCFPFCVRQYMPSVLWCSESFFRSIVCCEDKKKTPLMATTQVRLWPKMAQELNPRCWWKLWSRHNNRKIKWNTSDPTSTLAL